MTDYVSLARSIGELVQRKNQAYGNSFDKAADILRVLYPNGISVDKYDDVLTLTRMLDKFFRIATDRDAFGEDPYSDLAGYALLAHARRLEQTKPTSSTAPLSTKVTWFVHSRSDKPCEVCNAPQCKEPTEQVR